MALPYPGRPILKGLVWEGRLSWLLCLVTVALEFVSL